jgi:hypothetical protein
MMKINHDLRPADLKRKMDHFFELSARKLRTHAVAIMQTGRDTASGAYNVPHGESTIENKPCPAFHGS